MKWMKTVRAVVGFVCISGLVACSDLSNTSQMPVVGVGDYTVKKAHAVMEVIKQQHAQGGALAFMNQVYYFKPNQWQMRSGDVAALQTQVNYLVMHPGQHVLLVGHADTRGSRVVNMALGWMRANSVAQQLIGRGVQPGQITRISLGADNVPMSGRPLQVWAMSRRVHLIYFGEAVVAPAEATAETLDAVAPPSEQVSDLFGGKRR